MARQWRIEYPGALCHGMSRAMQWFGTSYTRRFNLVNGTGGHLFQGRFKRIIVENDAYVFRLSCTIHRNPLRAGLVERLDDYPWSSYRCNAYNKNPPDRLKTSAIWDRMPAADRRRAYRLKIQKNAEEEGRFREDVTHGLVYGGQDFVPGLKKRHLGGRKDDELPQHNSMFQDIDAEVVLEKPPSAWVWMSRLPAVSEERGLKQ